MGASNRIYSAYRNSDKSEYETMRFFNTPKPILLKNPEIEQVATSTKQEEYELKYLVNKNYIPYILATSEPAVHKVQGYIPIINNNGFSQVRISRRFDRDYGLITIKTVRHGCHRTEYHYRIPENEAFEMIKMCPGKITKERHNIMVNGFMWEVDFFKDKNYGLYLAEVEFPNEYSMQEFVNNKNKLLPPWVTKDVTNDMRYYNDYLAQNPYAYWKEYEE